MSMEDIDPTTLTEAEREAAFLAYQAEIRARREAYENAPPRVSPEFADAFDQAAAEHDRRVFYVAPTPRKPFARKRYLWWLFSPQYGQAMIRLRGKFYALKAPWCRPFYSERNRIGVHVIPLGFGWRITIRKVGE